MTEPTLHSLDKRLDTHEAVCAERWGAIRNRVSRIEAIGWTTLATMMTSFVGGRCFVAWFFFTKTFRLQ